MFEEKLPPSDSSAFKQKIESLSQNLNINPNRLMAVMYKESVLNPSITNSIGAAGLIQIVPSTAKAL